MRSCHGAPLTKTLHTCTFSIVVSASTTKVPEIKSQITWNLMGLPERLQNSYICAIFGCLTNFISKMNVADEPKIVFTV